MTRLEIVAEEGAMAASDGVRYGVIAYVPSSKFPSDDEAHFDGWYAAREWAEAVFEAFRQRYPTALVHLVTLIKSDWRLGDES